jgi:hypothetical protein
MSPPNQKSTWKGKYSLKMWLTAFTCWRVGNPKPYAPISCCSGCWAAVSRFPLGRKVETQLSPCLGLVIGERKLSFLPAGSRYIHGLGDGGPRCLAPLSHLFWVSFDGSFCPHNSLSVWHLPIPMPLTPWVVLKPLLQWNAAYRPQGLHPGSLNSSWAVFLL